MLEVVAFMPMRHSSERVPGKNYRNFNGKPLFHYMLETLLACPEVTQVVIDTDSEIVKSQCEEEFPMVNVIQRPEHLLGGDVPMTEILRNDASEIDSDWYLQVHSTSPLLRSKTISEGMKTLENSLNKFDSLISVTQLQTRLYDSRFNPINHDPSTLERTQDLPPLYEENSGMYVFSRDQILEGQRFGDRPLLFTIDPHEAIDIDEEPDFVLAETLHSLREGQEK